MRVLLIYPNWKDPLYATLPIGLASIAAVLLKNGYEVKALDSSAYDLKISQIEEYIKEYQPDLIGMSVMTPLIKQALRISKIAKDVSKAKIAIGGVHPSICPEEVISDENVDYAVMGEGEQVFLGLCNALKESQSLQGIKGLVYKDKGKIINNGPAELIGNLDELPFPAVYLFPLKKYRQSIGESSNFMTMMTSRGCPFTCTYCVNSCNVLFGKKYRAMSAERIIEEINYYISAYQTKEIVFYDDNFTFDTKRVARLCDLIIQNNLKFKWKCSSRIESINLELLKKMKKAGCYLIAYGVESGNEELLRSVKRFTNLGRVKDVFRQTHAQGIKTLAYFMMGFPDETKETIKKTIELAIKLDPNYIQFAIINPYPHTEIFEDYKKNNLLVTKDWSKYIYAGELTTPVIRTKALTAEELQKEYKNAIRRFYLRPRYIFKQLKSNFSIFGIRKNISGFIQVLRWLRSG